MTVVRSTAAPQNITSYGALHPFRAAGDCDNPGARDLDQPKRQLLGSRGAPGNTVNNRTSYWVPKHSDRVFVERVDIVSGVGPKLAREAGASRFNDIHRVVSNLGVFDLGGADDTMRLLSVHPGVSVDDVVAATGFELDIPAEVATTREPTAEELIIIREVLDPKGMRFKEVPQS